MTETYDCDGWCEYCGEEGAIFAPNPYKFDVRGDDTPQWICEACRKELEAEV